eukprot:875682-Ditylum_brightwellii.AAC.2
MKNAPVGSWRNDCNEHLWKFNMQCSILDVESYMVGVMTKKKGSVSQYHPAVVVSNLEVV